MKILQIGKYFRPSVGGMESHVEILARGLAGFADVRVLVSNTDGGSATEFIGGLTVHRLPRLGTALGAPLSIGYREQLRSDYDIIHIHAPNPAAMLAYLRHAPGHSRLVVTWHTDIVRNAWLAKPFRQIEKRFVDRARLVICASSRHIRNSSVLSRAADRCRVIPFGIDSDKFGHPGPAGGPAGEPVVLFVGRLVAYKGLEHLLRAMVDVPGRLKIVGDGPQWSRMTRLARQLGLGERVQFLGCVDDAELVSQYHQCSVMCLPSVSRAEALGIVLLEAMAAGKPVISTELGTATSLVNQHGVTGLVVPPADPAALGHAIRSLLANPLEMAAMGRRSRRRVRSEYDVGTMAQRTFDAYRSVVGKDG